MQGSEHGRILQVKEAMGAKHKSTCFSQHESMCWEVTKKQGWEHVREGLKTQPEYLTQPPRESPEDFNQQLFCLKLVSGWKESDLLCWKKPCYSKQEARIWLQLCHQLGSCVPQTSHLTFLDFPTRKVGPSLRNSKLQVDRSGFPNSASV